jgi:hypothetical protein
LALIKLGNFQTSSNKVKIIVGQIFTSMPKTSSSGFEKYIRTISILVPHLNVIVNPFFQKASGFSLGSNSENQT